MRLMIACTETAVNVATSDNAVESRNNPRKLVGIECPPDRHPDDTGTSSITSSFDSKAGAGMISRQRLGPMRSM